VVSGAGLREIGPRTGAAGFLENIGETRMDVLCTPRQAFSFLERGLNVLFEAMKCEFDSSLVGDAHQDHGLVAKLTCNTFRNYVI
jgi:hypothetical protein